MRRFAWRAACWRYDLVDERVQPAQNVGIAFQWTVYGLHGSTHDPSTIA